MVNATPRGYIHPNGLEEFVLMAICLMAVLAANFPEGVGVVALHADGSVVIADFAECHDRHTGIASNLKVALEGGTVHVH